MFLIVVFFVLCYCVFIALVLRAPGGTVAWGQLFSLSTDLGSAYAPQTLTLTLRGNHTPDQG